TCTMRKHAEALLPGYLSPEQVKHALKIYHTLQAYTEGEVTMSVIDMIPREEILQTRRWVNEASCAALVAELPEFAAYRDESED
ncbi:MAG: hypothetical protein WA952_14590, partial [Lewinella sp.]